MGVVKHSSTAANAAPMTKLAHEMNEEIFLHALVIVLAERDRDYRTAAHAEHVGERHQQDEDRVGQADGGYLQGIAGLSDEKRCPPCCTPR